MIKNKAAIYCRLSVEDMDKINKGDDSESIQNQKMILTDYAKKQGWEVTNIYSDDDCSGLDSTRKGFNNMINDAKCKTFDIILCKTQSRFTRDMELVEKYIHGLFIEWGIRFVTAVDHVDTDIKGNKKARQINGLINEWYCEDLSENIKAVFRQKMERGQFIGSFAPYGYIKDPDDKHKLIIDDEAAEVVRRIYDLYMEGYGAFKIAGILTNECVLTPSAYKNSKGLKFKNPKSQQYSIKFGVWAQNSVRRILQNPVYTGVLIQGMEKKLSYKSKKIIAVPKEEWIIVKNNHEPIISNEIFIKVKNLIEAKRSIYRNCKTDNSVSKKEYILSGRLRCKDCGANMQRTAMSRDKSTYYIKCGVNKKVKACTPHSIRVDVVEGFVTDRVKEIVKSYIHDEYSFKYIEDHICNCEKSKIRYETYDKKISEIDSKLQELPSTLTSAYKDKIRGVISDTDFISIKNTLELETEKYTTERLLLKDKINTIDNIKKTSNDLRNKINEIVDFKCLSYGLVKEFVEYIEIGEVDTNGEQEIILYWGI